MSKMTLTSHQISPYNYYAFQIRNVKNEWSSIFGGALCI